MTRPIVPTLDAGDNVLSSDLTIKQAPLDRPSLSTGIPLSKLQEAIKPSKNGDGGLLAFLALLFTLRGAALLLELRVKTPYGVRSGLFDKKLGRDAWIAVKQASEDSSIAAVWYGFNPVIPGILSRASGHINCKTAVTDDEVFRLDMLMVDIDPIRYCALSKKKLRSTGLPSTDAELAAAERAADLIESHFAALGWPMAIRIMSGNGVQLMFRISLAVEDSTVVKAVLHRLEVLFADETVEIDTSVANPARLGRMPGTINRKGTHTLERPHRMAAVTAAPDVFECVTREQLVAFAYEGSPPDSAATGIGIVPKHVAGIRTSEPNEWLQSWMTCHKPELDLLGIREKKLSGDGRIIWVLETCPYNDAHNVGEAHIDLLATGAISAGCHHNSCTWGWDFLRAYVEKAARTQILELVSSVQDDEALITCVQGIEQAGRAGVLESILNDDPELSSKIQRLDISPALQAKSRARRSAIHLYGDLHDRTKNIFDFITKTRDWLGIYRYRSQLARIIGHGPGFLIQVMTNKELRQHLLTTLRFLEVKGKRGWQPEDPKLELLDHILATPDGPFPILRGLYQHPVAMPDGRMVQAPGYVPEIESFVAFDNLQPFSVPVAPTDKELEQAWLMLMAPFADFPFEDFASLAHTMCMLLQPFVRTLVHGPTPLYLVTAPSPGTGKSLLVSAIAFIALGTPPTTITVSGRDGEELRKRITAVLADSPEVVLIDNFAGKLESGDFASLLTNQVWRDRELGHSRNVTFANLAMWVITANNPTISSELTRRAVLIRLDARSERPAERGGFKHRDLMMELTKTRQQLVEAACTIVQGWVAKGMPEGTQILGSFESWSRVLGGILESTSPLRLLANRDQLRLQVDVEQHEWHELLKMWWDLKGIVPTPAAQLMAIVTHLDILHGVRGSGDWRSQHIRLGKALAVRTGQIFGGLRIAIANSKERSGANRYCLEPTADAPQRTNPVPKGLNAETWLEANHLKSVEMTPFPNNTKDQQ